MLKIVLADYEQREATVMVENEKLRTSLKLVYDAICTCLKSSSTTSSSLMPDNQVLLPFDDIEIPIMDAIGQGIQALVKVKDSSSSLLLMKAQETELRNCKLKLGKDPSCRTTGRGDAGAASIA